MNEKQLIDEFWGQYCPELLHEIFSQVSHDCSEIFQAEQTGLLSPTVYIDLINKEVSNEA